MSNQWPDVLTPDQVADYLQLPVVRGVKQQLVG